MSLPTDRTIADTAADHVADHNTLHAQFNTVLAGGVFVADGSEAMTGDLDMNGNDIIGTDSLLGSSVLGSAAAYIEISSIPATHRDLIIQATLRSDDTATSDLLELNVGNSSIDTGTNYRYSFTRQGTASSTANASGDTKIRSTPNLVADTATSGFYTYYRIRIYDYASTSRDRLVAWESYRDVDGNRIFERGNALWNNSADAIDVVRFSPTNGSNLMTGSEVRIWGD